MSPPRQVPADCAGSGYLESCCTEPFDTAVV